jgi:hypothetical protein
LLVAVAFALGAVLTWRKWPDVLIDFGRDLYLPWRISSGSVLYRDVMYLTAGPLSEHYHALLFKVFGASLLTVIISNLVITGGLLVLIYRFFLRASDAWTATLVCLGVVLVFAFNQYSTIGNFNFMTPYCHEVWHGVVISVVALVLLSKWIEQPQSWAPAGAGFCAGLVFMTKPEVFAALLAALAGAFFLAAWTRRRPWGLLKSAATLVAGSLLPLAAFTLYFHRAENWGDSLQSVAFAWAPLLHSDISKDHFYRWCLGLDNPGMHLRKMFSQFLVICVGMAVSGFLFRRKMDVSTNRLFAVAWIALLLGLASGFDWVDCGRSLPLLLVALGALLWAKDWAADPGPPPVPDGPRSRAAFPLLWAIFALALLGKLGFFPRIWHYGFILAMPAFVGAVYLMTWVAPAWLEKHGVHRGLFRVTASLVLCVGFLRLFVQSQMVYRHKTVEVGSGRDRMLAFDANENPAGPAVQAALVWIETNVPRDATLAVLPEGVMINYLSRHTNPAKYLVWNPTELAFFGQAKMVEAFKSGSPDYVVLVHRDADEYGVKFFGQADSFGGELLRWIETHYEPVQLIGHEPLRNSLFGIKILKRISNER